MLSPSELERLGQFLPLAVLGNLQRGPSLLFEGEDGVVLLGEGGCQVFGAIVVDQLQAGPLAADLCRGDDPAEAVVLLAQIARELTVKLLSGHLDILLVEIDAQIHFILLIGEVGFEGALCLGTRGNGPQVANEE